MLIFKPRNLKIINVLIPGLPPQPDQGRLRREDRWTGVQGEPRVGFVCVYMNTFSHGLDSQKQETRELRKLVSFHLRSVPTIQKILLLDFFTSGQIRHLD
jgi:hypothetical protein